MGIETTYNQLSSQIKRDNKKRNRTENIMGIASVAAASYQKNLKKEREELLKSSELNNKKVRRQAGLDLYTNKYKTLYEQGTQSLGGLRTFLIDGKATEIAKQKLDAEVREGRIANPDEYNKIVRSYATEMVDGSKREGEDPQKGMLESLTSAYNKGKTLKSTEEYERFLVDKADLPENAGVAIVNKIFGGKNKAQINEDALKRISEENDFDKNLAAFEVLDKAFNAGAGFAGAESLANQYVDQIKKEKLVSEYTNKKRIEKKGQYLAPDGKMTPIAYSVIVGIDAEGVETTLPNSVEAIKGNPISKQFVDSIKINGKQLVMYRSVTRDQVSVTTGIKTTGTEMEAYYATGENIGKTIIEKNPITKKEIDEAIIESAAVEDSVIERADRMLLSWAGKTNKGNSDERRSAILNLKENESQLDEVDNEDYRKAVNRLFLQRANSMASVIRDQYKTGYETSFQIAYQLMYENSKTDEKSFYTGINTTDKDNLNINSYRVFEAISELDQNSNVVLNLGVSSKDKFVEEFVLLHLNKENSELKIKEWDAVSKTQLRETNEPVGDTKITSDIWKARVPHPLYQNINATSEEKKIRISLYERYLYHAYGIDPLQVKKQEQFLVEQQERKERRIRKEEAEKKLSLVDRVQYTPKTTEEIFNEAPQKNSSKIIDEAAVSILGKSPTQTPDETVENITPSLKKNRKIRDIQLIQPDFSVEDSPISDEEIALRGLSRQEYNKLSLKEMNLFNISVLKSRKNRLKQLKTPIQS